MARDERMKGYFEILRDYYEAVQETATKATDRGMRVSRELMDEVSHRQQEMAEVSRRAAAGEDLKSLYPRMLESTVAAQTSALKLYQTLQEESMGAYIEARESMQELVRAAMRFAETAAHETREWSSANPFGARTPGASAGPNPED
ncbi:MAG: hypothetical protein AB7F65_11290 [Dehalococcoidia bacterium]